MATELKTPIPQVLLAHAASALIGTALASLPRRDQQMLVGGGLALLSMLVLMNLPPR